MVKSIDDIKIVLASKSPRRKELLSLIDINFIIYGTVFDESSIIYNGKDIDNYVIELSKGKCMEASSKYPDRIILGADTIVYINNEILGKPNNKEEAYDYLDRLSNNSHSVITGLCLYNGLTKQMITDFDITTVYVQELKPEEIKWYINSDNVEDAAGGYRIQQGFSRFITRIEGSYHNVVGLPVNKVYNNLKKII
jgi:septum formation protein